MAAQTVGTAATLAFILAGGFPLADRLARIADNDIFTGLVFFSLLFIGSELLGLPFSIYRTFVLEARFGFNTTTPGTFVLDRLKGYLLAAVLGLPLLAAVLLLFTSFGPWAWALCWAVTTLFSVTLTFLAPSLIMPLFNTFTPLEDRNLLDRLRDLARRTGFGLGGVFVMDGSKRSTKANAFFTGLGRTKRIALYDTLLAAHEADEIEAILAHEIGHYRLGHITRGLVLSILQTGLLLALMGQAITLPGLYEAFGMTSMPVHAGLVFFLLLYSPVSLMLTPFFAGLSRRREFEADRFAAAHLPSPEPLIRALKKISGQSLANLTPHPWYVFFHYSHPPLGARIAALADSGKSARK
ncbi:MAG TPA: peptidase M48 [Desulfomicrobium sp.]|nr:peptidase M48 [Desulfomicrobium sp.]